jgi:hypothetical protein
MVVRINQSTLVDAVLVMVVRILCRGIHGH